MVVVAAPLNSDINRWLFNMEDQDALPTEGSSDSFQNFLAQNFLARVDLPDVQRAEGSISSPRSKDVASNQETASDTGMGRDVLHGQAAAVNFSAEPTSHPSSAAGSEHTPSADIKPPRGRGRGRGRQRKRVSGQGETAQQRAHRRFYERKKQKLSALEQEAAEKLALYQRLVRENSDLKRKYDALKYTISGSDEQMSLLQAMSSLSLNPNAQQAAASAPQQQAVAVTAQQQHQMTRTGQEPFQQAAGAAAMPALHQQGGTVSPHVHSLPLPSAAAVSSAAAAHRRTGSAPLESLLFAQQQQQQIPQHVAAAGPFGLVQLQAQESPTAATADASYAWLQPVIKPDQQMLLPQLWPDQQQLQPAIQPEQQMVPPHQQQVQQLSPPQQLQQCTPQQQSLGMMRSVSMPARQHYASDPGAGSSSMAAAVAQGVILPGQPVTDMPRAYSSGPYASQGSSSSSVAQQQRTALPSAAAVNGWTAGPSRLQQASNALPQQEQQQPQQCALDQQQQWREHSFEPRHQNWSGSNSPTVAAAAIAQHYQRQQQQCPLFDHSVAVQRSTQSFPGASPAAPAHVQQMHGSTTVTPASQQQQQQQQQQQLSPVFDAGAPAAAVGWQQQLQQQQLLARRGFHTITTGGPFPQQQLQLGRVGSDPTALGRHVTLLPQQQQQQLLPQHQQQQPLVLPAMPPVDQQQQQYVVDQATGNLIPQPTDDFMMIDDELMMLLEKELSQQQPEQLQEQLQQQQQFIQQQQQVVPEQSAGFSTLSPLPSLPSAGADLAAAAAVHQQQQQQQGMIRLQMQPPVTHVQGLQSAAAAGPPAAAVVGFPPQTILVASRMLQARHEAAGYFPAAAAAAAGEAEFCYVHQVVDWYRCKMHQLADLIPRVDRPCPDVSAGVALVKVVEELITAIRKFSTRNRIGLWEIKLINLETGDFEEAPPIHWRSVYHSIGFAPTVREKLDGCWSLYKEYVQKAREERQEILREMAALQADLSGEDNTADQSAAAPDAPPPRRREAPATLQFRRDGYEEWQAMLTKLQLSLQREHMVANIIMYSCAQVASHIQMAKAMLNSYPYWPDGPAILTVLHEEEQLAAAAAAGRSAWPEPPGRMRSI